MSGYFDGLMRSSGLPLGGAPVLGRTPRSIAPLETDVATSAAAPLIGPLELAARTVGPPTVAAPSTASAAVPLLTSDPAPPPADLPRPAASLPPRTAPTSTPPVAEPVVTHERIIQAAMRWIAEGSVQPQHAPDTAPAMTEAVLREGPAAEARSRPISPASSVVTSPGEAGEPSVTGTVESQPVEPASRRAAAEILPPAAATPVMRAAPRTLPAHDDVHVSIGAIHLRVEAPAPPALQAAAAATPRPAASPPVTNRTGLSRRALRRI